MKLSLVFLMASVSSTTMAGTLIEQPGKSPLVTLRVVFRTGAASDPKGKEGLASLTADMVSEAGTRRMTFQQIIDALFPMAVSVDNNVDKEMTSFSTETHIDNLEKFYRIFRQMVLEPGFRDEDLRRLKDETINYLETSLRGNNDEELGKEVLYSEIYGGHPYAHHNQGTVSAIQAITMDDIRQFYRAHYTGANLTIAIAGGYPKNLPRRINKDFSVLPKGTAAPLQLPVPKPVQGRELVMIEKQTRSVAMSMGFPIDVKRGHPDYVALLVAHSWLGQHRTSGVRLYERIREKRGLNYGDYAYIEYFPRGMFQSEPDPNHARQQQIFQVWIRPVLPPTAHFTLRLAIYELERLHRDGLTQEGFDDTVNFLSKYVNLLTKTKRAELGYAIDSRFYGIADYNTYLKSALTKLTRDEVNRAIRKHLSPLNMKIVLVGQDSEKLRNAILRETPSPMTYNSPKDPEILEEDKLVEKLPLHIKPEVKIVKVETVFQ